jgi:hypothetical protein
MTAPVPTRTARLARFVLGSGLGLGLACFASTGALASASAPPATDFIPLVSYQGFSFVRPADISALVHSHTDRCRVFLRNGQFFDVNENCSSVYNKVEPRRAPSP